MAQEVLTDRVLSRATLARQLLLERSTLAPTDAVAHLVGLQAQNPLDPYVALWSRLDRFDPVALGELVESRALVRMVVMRGTIHLVTAADALVLRPLMQPVLDAEIARHRDFAPHLVGIDVEPVLAFAREILGERPHTTAQLRAAMAARFPDLHPGALAYACRCFLPLVQVPPRGVWGKRAQVTLMTTDGWLGRPAAAAASSIDDVVLRYLRAFGPATVADVTAWCGLTGMRAVVERLRPSLVTFRDDRGRELFDVPDGPRPDPDTPAPVRLLPEYDNVLLSHADRSRFAGHVMTPDDRSRAWVLVDGVVAGSWRWEGDTVAVELAGVTKKQAAAVDAEARRLVRLGRGG
ncbi:MAG: winged helix DNA-binding domain-containing protein [Actinomycetota bacterium]